MILSSTSAIRRLRQICCNLRRRHCRAADSLATQGHLVAQLEEANKHLQSKAALAKPLRESLEATKDELARRVAELQETQVKMNENYKLLAELSNENLKLTGDKLKAEEILTAARKEERRLRDEIRRRDSYERQQQEYANVQVHQHGQHQHIQSQEWIAQQPRSSSSSSSYSRRYHHHKRRGGGGQKKRNAEQQQVRLYVGIKSV